jgi:hypothetical protein
MSEPRHPSTWSLEDHRLRHVILNRRAGVRRKGVRGELRRTAMAELAALEAEALSRGLGVIEGWREYSANLTFGTGFETDKHGRWASLKVQPPPKSTGTRKPRQPDKPAAKTGGDMLTDLEQQLQASLAAQSS